MIEIQSVGGKYLHTLLIELLLISFKDINSMQNSVDTHKFKAYSLLPITLPFHLILRANFVPRPSVKEQDFLYCKRVSVAVIFCSYCLVLCVFHYSRTSNTLSLGCDNSMV